MAYDYYNNLGKEDMAARMLNSIGAANYQQGHYEEALKNYLESIAIRRRIGDKEGVSRVLNNIGKAYFDRGRHEDAAEYFQQALEIAKETNHDGLIAYSFFNLGEVEEEKGNLELAFEYYDLSQIHYRIDKDFVSLIQTLNSIGSLASKRGDHESALTVLTEAYNTAFERSHREGMADALMHLGKAYKNAKDYSNAFDAYRRSIDISNKTGTREKLRETYGLLSELYTATGDHESALDIYKQFTALQDSIFSEETAKNIDRMRIAYESELHEQENEVLRDRQLDQEALLKRNRLINILISLFLATAIVFSVILYKMYRGKMHANVALEATNSQITSQRNEIENKNRELEEAIHRIKTLAGLLPICANCKKIRDDDGYWQDVEAYIGRHSDAMFTHGICPDCITKLYPEFDDDNTG